MKIAVDAMGGDYAPSIVIDGVAQALEEFPYIDEIVLVGHLDKIAYYLEKNNIANDPRISLVHANTVVEMKESSTLALRRKKDSSITTCAKLLKEKRVSAIVSAGHTGAAVASTKVITRTLPGIDRPAIAATLPGREGYFIVVDAGANTDCQPLNLAQFAIMGEAYAHYFFGINSPRIGLLSVGGEDIKGNDLTKETFKILSEMPINFVGNVEGDSIFEGVCDVVVCDGFMGNVLLKGTEGLAKAVLHWMKDVFTRNPVRKAGAMMARNAFKDLKTIGDADEFGGAPLLGINGTCIIGHGGSSAKAVKNAIRVAADFIKYRLNDRIVSRIEESQLANGQKDNENGK